MFILRSPLQRTKYTIGVRYYSLGSLSLEREEMWPLFLTNINGHIEPILEHNHYCDDNVLNLKRHSGNISFVRPLDLLRFSCNQCFKKGQ